MRERMNFLNWIWSIALPCVFCFLFNFQLMAQSNDHPSESTSRLWAQRSLVLFKNVQPYLMKWHQNGFKIAELFDAVSSSIKDHIKNNRTGRPQAHSAIEKALAAPMGYNTLKNAYT